MKKGTAFNIAYEAIDILEKIITRMFEMEEEQCTNKQAEQIADHLEIAIEVLKKVCEQNAPF